MDEATAAMEEPLLDNLVLTHGTEQSSGIKSSGIRSPAIAFTLPQMAAAIISTAWVSLPRNLDEFGVESM